MSYSNSLIKNLADSLNQSEKPQIENYQNDPIGFVENELVSTLIDDQKAILNSLLKYRITVVESANSVGKCVAYGERIDLPDGTTVSAESMIGKEFKIWAVDETYSPVLATAYAEDNGEQDVVEIITESGRGIIRTGNHPIVTADSKFQFSKTPVIGNPRWEEVGKLSIGDIVLCVEKQPYLDSYSPIPDEHIRLLAYLIADGCLNYQQMTYCKRYGAILDEFIRDAETLGCKLAPTKSSRDKTSPGWAVTNIDRSVHKNQIYELIRAHGLWGKGAHHKFIPDSIKQLPDDKLALFLSRLFASDGWAAINKPGKDRKSRRENPSIGYSSVSETLCQDIQKALLRFGIVGTIRKKKTTWTHKGVRKYSFAYSYEILSGEMKQRFIDHIGLFANEDRENEIRELLAGNSRKTLWRNKDIPDWLRWEKIRSLNYLPSMPTVAICVPQYQTYVTDFVEHNSFLAARAALWFLCANPASMAYMVAAPPENNLRRILWGELLNAVSHASPSVTRGLIRRDLFISYSPKHAISGLTIPTAGTPEERQGKFSGHHAPHQLFIMDEADAIPIEVFQGVESCMSGEDQHLLIILNPRHPSGWVYSLRESPEVNVITLSAFNHPNVITGKNVVPGAVDRETTVRRIQTWTRPLGVHEKEDETTVFIVPDFLDGCTTRTNDGEERMALVGGEKRVVMDGYEEFDHMVLGRYPAKAGRQLIARSWVKAAQNRYKEWAKIHGEKPPEGVKPRIGLDIGVDSDPTVLCQRYGDWVAPFAFWKIADQEESGDKVKSIIGDMDYERLFIDHMGSGTGMSSQLRKKGLSKITAVKVGEKPTMKVFIGTEDVLGEFAAIRDQLMWAVREWLRSNPNSMIPENQTLEEELITPTYSPDGKKIKVMSKNEIRKRLSGRSCDFFDSLALTMAPETTILLGLI